MCVQVCFKRVDEILDFVSEMERVPFHVDACCGSYTVDAKSIMGMMSIGIGKKVELKLYTEDNTGELEHVIGNYAA